MSRTPEEIVARITAIEVSDPLGFQRADLIEALPYEQVKPYLKDGITAEEWGPIQSTDPIAKARDYLGFAWGKANNCRGISAMRSVNHLQAWIWLAGFDHFDRIANAEYQFYGKPVLVIASEALGFDWRAADDGRWRNDELSEGVDPGEPQIARLIQIAQPLKAHIDSVEAAARGGKADG